MNRVVIIGGGPGGYEAALVAAQLHARVTVIDSDGIGGSAVLTDCVPSKTLIATAEVMTDMAAASELGVKLHESAADGATTLRVDLARLNARVKKLAADQSADITSRLEREGVRIIRRTRPSRWREYGRRNHRGRRRGTHSRRHGAHRHGSLAAGGDRGAARRGADPDVGAGL